MLLNLVGNSKWKAESSPESCENGWHEIPTLLTRITNTMCPLAIWVRICHWKITRKALLGTTKLQVWKWVKWIVYWFCHIKSTENLLNVAVSNYSFLNIQIIVISILNNFYLKGLKSAYAKFLTHNRCSNIFLLSAHWNLHRLCLSNSYIFFKIRKQLLRTTWIGIIGDIGMKSITALAF